MSSRTVIVAVSLAVVLTTVVGFSAGVAWTQRKWDNAIQMQKTVDDRETKRRVDEQLKISKEARAKVAAAQLDADTARGHAERLQRSFAQQRSSDTGVVESCSATDEAWNLRSELFGRVVNRTSELAEYADAARIAGEACQQQYNSLGEPHAK